MSEKKGKILIIDDQPSEVKMVKMALEQANYEVCYAYNGKVGIEKAVQEKPDLILLDIMMPEKDGFITCGELKKKPETSSVPVIILTSIESSSLVFPDAENAYATAIKASFYGTDPATALNEAQEKVGSIFRGDILP